MERRHAIIAMRWTARLFAAALFLLWGAFFVEHTTEWFAHPLQELPPLRVIGLHVCHLLLLVALVVAWRWEGIGGAMIVVFSILFFGNVHALHFLILTIIPGVLFLATWYWDCRAGRNTSQLKTV